MNLFIRRKRTFFLTQHTPQPTLLHVLMQLNGLGAADLGNRWDMPPPYKL